MIEKEFLAELETRLDDMKSKIEALELAVTQIPQINFQTDPSRLSGVVVEPAALVDGL